ncbi:hypothetical protein BGZ88_000286, partial [Linnemannia elongata]
LGTLEEMTMKEEVSMPTFASKFGYHSEADAHPAYLDLVASTSLPQAPRARL